ncbi:MAG TPA: nickel transporter permease [bacterium]|nr:nickel transporter permease [bacterium]
MGASRPGRREATRGGAGAPAPGVLPFSAGLATVRGAGSTSSVVGRASRAEVLRRAIWRSPLTLAGVIIVALFACVAIVGPQLAVQSPTAQDLAHRLAPPSARHPFGLDSLGRDVYSRVVYGARISVTSGISVVAAIMCFGTIAGMAAGWLGGWWDETLMRVTDMFLAFPSLVLAMAISAVLRPSLTNALLAIVVTSWPPYGRLSRAQILSLRSRDYVEAARAQGLTDTKIILRHLIPNALAPLLVQATLDVGSIILTVAGLSFIGFGAQPPTPEWGRMVSDGREFLMEQWWVATFPAVAIMLFVLGFNLVGDGIRDILDPRLRKAE